MPGNHSHALSIALGFSGRTGRPRSRGRVAGEEGEHRRRFDDPGECRVREPGATAAVLGDEGKAVGPRIPAALLSGGTHVMNSTNKTTTTTRRQPPCGLYTRGAGCRIALRYRHGAMTGAPSRFPQYYRDLFECGEQSSADAAPSAKCGAPREASRTPGEIQHEYSDHQQEYFRQ